ncbi:MAG TPA: GntR family transcriptional regulator [Devosia sp.]|jgi:GntR family transcriptional regulator|nr:GntR family transcriptional regulator [Devosia sp.]
MNALSREDVRPLYKQVKDRLLEALSDGTVPPMGKLASERELVEKYGVSRITVRQAMRELVAEGHLRSHPGKGFYATGRSISQAFELELLRSFTATALRHGLRPGAQLISGKAIAADEKLAAALHIRVGDPAVELRRLRLLDGEPVAIAEDWIEMAKVPGLLALDWKSGNRSLYDELRQRYGLHPESGETVLSSRLASADEAKLLGLRRPAAVLTVEQIAYSRDGTPINATRSIHHPTRYPLRLEQGKS